MWPAIGMFSVSGEQRGPSFGRQVCNVVAGSSGLFNVRHHESNLQTRHRYVAGTVR